MNGNVAACPASWAWVGRGGRSTGSRPGWCPARRPGCAAATRSASKWAGSGPSCRPLGTNRAALPSAWRMNGSAPPSAAGPVAPGSGTKPGGLFFSKSGTSWPVHSPASLVPPDVGLGRAPRAALRVGRGPVVQDPPVGRPGPAPLRRHPGLHRPGHPPRGLVHPAREAARVDPARRRRWTRRRLELGEGGQRRAVGGIAVQLGQHRLGGRLGLGAVLGVVPGQVEHRPVGLGRGAGQPGPDPLAQVVDERQVAAGVAGRVQRLGVPLEQPLGVGEAAVLLHVRGGGQEEHLGRDLLGDQLAGGDLRRRSSRTWRSRSGSGP